MMKNFTVSQGHYCDFMLTNYLGMKPGVTGKVRLLTTLIQQFYCNNKYPDEGVQVSCFHKTLCFFNVMDSDGLMGDYTAFCFA